MALGLLALLAVGADRGAAWATSESVTAAVERGGTDVVDADVQIHGFPFLTQLAAGSLERVTASLERGSFGGYGVSDVSIDARGVRPRSPWTTRQASADGVVAFDTIAAVMSERLGTDVTMGPAPGDPGAITLGTSVTVLGAAVDVSAVVLPDVVDGELAVQVRGVSVGGADVAVDALPGGLGDRLSGLRIPLDLPDGITLVGARGETDGVRLTIDARDVALDAVAW
ncbi:hypothetical protein Xcel_0086 [Xylanimonas cellulosilytica DSM 15894]|uniref:DUF2993 domain-containing protein n=1 Tax=Xylanimonas cellulosilytica (strain DSM 15894 / JCM 12276 / CECT 5975 / KCTC 9989 / LMG 20990 / NBRC 107835 / XIL07) TaxID=446471 RepID=D1BTW3_XYLCX|nr:DUF2993 domain-containing protein [Xylanimonas cellulosilytica]ACZ29127.1 hypothetical protein Xcel_0086 [Xylanimonas cellulosilytica DSM 15894]